MRKWNKLLALVLAMVMVFGLTATAFAEEAKDEDTTPAAETTEAAEGDEDKADDETAAPADGETAAPADGETAAPADDETAAPAGDEDAAPADDETAAPADGEDAAPADDEDAAPADDEDATPAADLSDVAAWAKDAVSAVLEKGLITAGANGFDPKANMTRADLVTALYVLAGSPSTAGVANPFTDVTTNDSYKDAVVWAYSKEIVVGKSADKFDPTGDVKRQEIAKILFVYANAENVAEDNLSKFADADKIAGWAKDYVNWAATKGLINGKAAQQNTVNMDPTGTATRQEVAVILVNYIDNILSDAPADAAADAPADAAADAPADAAADAPADAAADAPADAAADAPADDAADAPADAAADAPADAAADAPADDTADDVG